MDDTKDDDTQVLEELERCRVMYRLTREAALAEGFTPIHIITALSYEMVDLLAHAPTDASHEDFVTMLEGLVGGLRHDTLAERACFLAEELLARVADTTRQH